MRPSQLTPLAVLTLALLLSGPARAEYPCGFAGPGEIVVGQTEGGNGVASVPLCEYVGEDDGTYNDDSAPQGYWADQYATLVWGTDRGGQPSYAWYLNAPSQAVADAGAMDQCRASGLADCVVATYVVNGSIAVAVDTGGMLYSDWGTDPREARKKVLKYCKAQGGKGCKVEQVLDSPAAWVGQ